MNKLKELLNTEARALQYSKDNQETLRAEFNAVAKASNYSNFDASTLSELDEKDRQRIEFSVCGLTQALGLMSGSFTSETVWNFPFDIEGVKVIEKFLLESVKPLIVKFDVNANRYPVLTRVRSLKGIATSNPERIREVESRMTQTAGFVLGQCIAQHTGGKWVRDSGNFIIRTPNGGKVQPYWKPLKFVCFGDEDGLVGWMHILKPAPEIAASNERILSSAKAWMDSTDQDGRFQLWYGPDGSIEQIKYFSKDGRVCKVLPLCAAARNDWERFALQAAQRGSGALQ